MCSQLYSNKTKLTVNESIIHVVITNKTKRFSFESGCVIWVAKRSTGS